MKTKKLVLIGILAIAMTLIVSIASAQEGGNPNRPQQQGQQGDPLLRDLMDIVVTETGLEAQQIMEQWRDGTSLASIITANGGDVNNVINQAVVLVAERVTTAVAEGKITQEQADEILAGLEDRITSIMNSDRPPRQDNNRDNPQNDPMTGAIMETLVEQTSLEPETIMEQLRDGATIADVLAANGIDANVFVAAVTAKMETQIGEAVANERITQEQADEILAGLEDRITQMINSKFPPPQRQGSNDGNPMRQQIFGLVLRAAVEQTGLEPEAIMQQLRDGATLSEILANAGIDEATFTAGVVAQMDAQLETQIAQILNVPGGQLLQQNRPDNRPGNRPGQDRIGDLVREELVTQTGLDPEAIREQLESGATLADILAGAGIDVDVFVAGIVAQVETDISEAVANGNITQEQADRALEGLPERLTEMLNNNPGRPPQGK